MLLFSFPQDRNITILLHFLALLTAAWSSPCLLACVLTLPWCSGSMGMLRTWCVRCCWSAAGRSSTLRNGRKETGTRAGAARLSAAHTMRTSCPGRGWITTTKQALSHAKTDWHATWEEWEGRTAPHSMASVRWLSSCTKLDYTRFLEEHAKNRYWICKPVDLSRGRGIFIFRDIKHLTYDSTVIVQKYISNPFLISGYEPWLLEVN